MGDLILNLIKPCKACGTADRYVSGKCKSCQKLRVTTWQAANKEKCAENMKRWAAENKDKVKAAGVKRYAENPEKNRTAQKAYYVANLSKVQARHAKYAANNKEKVAALKSRWAEANQDRVIATKQAWVEKNPTAARIRSNNRRARKKVAGGRLSKGLAEKLFALQQGLCPCCAQPLGDNYHIDHITPLKLGGANEDWNIQLLRQRCNNQKYAKHPIDFMQQKGFLL